MCGVVHIEDAVALGAAAVGHISCGGTNRDTAESAGEETPARSRQGPGSPSTVTLRQKGVNDGALQPTPDVRLYHRAVVVAQENTGTPHCIDCNFSPSFVILLTSLSSSTPGFKVSL